MKCPILLLLIMLLLCIVLPAAAAPVISNHISAHPEKIPVSAILAAKSRLHIAYWHTSHGSQITTGMSGLASFPNAPYGGSVYTYNSGEPAEHLIFRNLHPLISAIQHGQRLPVIILLLTRM